jgi:hypothetical protein
VCETSVRKKNRVVTICLLWLAQNAERDAAKRDVARKAGACNSESVEKKTRSNAGMWVYAVSFGLPLLALHVLANL